MISNKQKALIHVAKSKTGMTDAEYRDLLGSIGRQSCVELDQAGFDFLMARFEKLGFKIRATRRRPRSKRKFRVPESKEMMMRKVAAILSSLGLTWSYADAMARHMFGIDAVQWCDPDQLYKIVAALSYHQNRRKRGDQTRRKRSNDQ